MVTSHPTLVLICKRPVLGHGKQRLAASLGAETALRIADALLRCALEDLAAWPGPKVLCPSSSNDALWAAGLLEASCPIVCQGEGNLGARLVKLDNQLRQHGHREILYMGSDAPMLTVPHFSEAAQGLTNAQVVLSAAKDGGVVLMGTAAPWPNLEALPWSTERLGRELQALCEIHGLAVQHIRPGYDIDIEQDLHQLFTDLRDDRRPGRVRLLSVLDEWTTNARRVVPQTVDRRSIPRFDKRPNGSVC